MSVIIFEVKIFDEQKQT